MLKITATDVKGNSFALPSPAYLTINQDEDVPADDLSLTIPININLTEINFITAEDNGVIVFSGPVDEQQTIVSEDSVYTKLTARSMASVLLDNESKPVNYMNPSTYVIFSRHLLPCGITKYKGEEKVMKDMLNISKGTTNWQAFYSFCVNTYGKMPRIEPDGTANFNGLESDREILFSNTEGINYNSVLENNKRCRLISDVWVKTTDNSGYITDVYNPDARERGILRCRYLDASASSSSLTVADKIINNATDSSYEITLVCPERLLDIIGAKAAVKDNYIGKVENLYVSSIYYSLRPDGEHTTVTLKKEN